MDQQTQPTQKQQITELLRGGNNFIVTTVKDPSVDQLSAVLALTLMLRKTGKNVQGLIKGKAPSQADFLPDDVLSAQTQAQRDFIIEVDTSQTEADKLKYTTEGKKLRVYITPFQGNFTDKDVDFSYGDYHVDGVIALGMEDNKQLQQLFADEQEILDKAKVLAVNNQADAPHIGSIAWNEDASSLSEMVMSMSEALQNGIIDQDIARTLLTGIIAATDQFSNANTTPKVMTMAAQLMAAGANQADIMKHLGKTPKQQESKPAKDKSSDKDTSGDGDKEKSEKKEEPSDSKPAPQPEPKPAEPDQPTPQPEQPAAKPSDQSETKPESENDASSGQLKPSQEESLSPLMSHQMGDDRQSPQLPQDQQPPQPPQPSQPTPQPSQTPQSPPQQPQQPQQPQAAPSETPSAEPSQPTSRSPQPPAQDVNAARQAIEQATQETAELQQQLQTHYQQSMQAGEQPTPAPQPPQQPQNQLQSQQPQQAQPPSPQPSQQPQQPSQQPQPRETSLPQSPPPRADQQNPNSTAFKNQ